MAHGAFKVLDSDIHIIEPPDLWPRYIDPAFRERAPIGLTEDEGDLRLAHAGKPWGRVAGVDADRNRRRQGKNYLRNQDRWKPYAERGWTPKVQLEAMDIEGIDVAVVYPSRGLFALTINDMDPPLAAAMARAYNDWLHGFCQENPERLLGAGMISPFDVNDAVAEARRCVRQLGFRAMFLRPNEVNGRNWHDPYYEPLWRELEELETPLGFHEGSGSQLRQVGEQFGSNTMLKHVYSHPVEQMLAVGAFCAGGILARHPKLRVAFLEGNCSWVPFLLWRMDEHHEWLGDVYAKELTMAPSAYFKRQCFVSVECDEEPVKHVIDAIGDDRIVFSTDFPHGDSKFPEAVESFLRLPISEESKRKILWDNCAAYYGLLS
jgi:predicted TIM-barrel fold metal-dependent hydrolase